MSFLRDYGADNLMRHFMINLTVVLFFSCSCASIPKGEQFDVPVTISREEFAAKPFGFDLTIRNFEENYKNVLKRQRYFMTMPNTGRVDTIYRFYKGKKTGVFFHKYGRFDGRIMGGKIRKPQIELNNGIRTGMSREEFFRKFSDWEYNASNNLTIESPATRCTFTFVFSRNKLKEIKFAVKKPDK